MRVEIPKDNGKGVRLLGIPTVQDRLIQQAISQVLAPIYDKEFSKYIYGFRSRRYAEMAIVQALEYMNDGYDWIVDIDLGRFFDTVHHDRLMNLVSRTIDDSDVISLIRKFEEFLFENHQAILIVENSKRLDLLLQNRLELEHVEEIQLNSFLCLRIGISQLEDI